MLRERDAADGLARRIGADVSLRAEALASSQRDQEVMSAPFVEEVYDHEPVDISLDLKVKVTLVCVTACSSRRTMTARGRR
ncbi:hypothetical protein AB0M36_25440 [Actinoplanes sp. NPDC051346]|uniref:hypothetical protein n=1 Tax=Actinoplanes sp. NPDC051346 TaxID=3155048 RepID=UPI00341C41FD